MGLNAYDMTPKGAHMGLNVYDMTSKGTHMELNVHVMGKFICNKVNLIIKGPHVQCVNRYRHRSCSHYWGHVIWMYKCIWLFRRGSPIL
jgi:hypothetical protein